MKLLTISLLFFICIFSWADTMKNEWERTNKEKISLTLDKVKKRNKPGCDRLGNVYGYCEWIVVLKVRNYSNKALKKFCSYLKVNQKKFDFCYGKKGKIVLNKKDEKTILLNLLELVRYPNDYEQPLIKLSNKQFIF